MELLKGAPVSAAIGKEIKEKLAVWEGRKPTLAIVRAGEKEDDLSYERGAVKRMNSLGIQVRLSSWPEDVSFQELADAVEALSKDSEVDGILVLRPLPRTIDEEKILERIDPAKDVDGVTKSSLADVFIGREGAFAPCTAEAVVTLLKHYEVPLSGARAVVAGRSLVVGKPLSMLLLKENCTVTICHSRTRDLGEVCRQGDILVTAVGKPEMFGRSYVADGAVVVDVGIHVKEDGSLAGDVNRLDLEEKDCRLTPVPGGLGAVTTAILARHVVEAAGHHQQRG